MAKGRPLKTEIRENIASILKHTNIAYGYQIYKIYKDIFGNISLRNLYYNLKKGAELGEFVLINIKKEEGYFTWGNEAEHKYYTLGPYALLKKANEIQKLKLSKLKLIDINFNWMKEVKQQIAKLEEDIKNFNSIKVRLKYEDKRKYENKLKSNIANLKDWLKQKIGRNNELINKINTLNNLINPPTP